MVTCARISERPVDAYDDEDEKRSAWLRGVRERLKKLCSQRVAVKDYIHVARLFSQVDISNRRIMRKNKDTNKNGIKENGNDEDILIDGLVLDLYVYDDKRWEE